ncbi:4-hydroxy-3-methylbut-2-enyl diphosphate reductase [Flagellatimonas centrodinii]|uniref:4-hydroxy-3-methylbut-2-enyl diphosphate reductase n=1 Tax=Flagellatimonas centrodinii TaxID=2806210 RepID=UPI001FEDA175|nr:4-hydroxy-3-methylbut-2-enyl diphosphate reductase [Flagellatimonas centrodinii]ULQ46816.1 4-hydroxy-3-methylbut-2-enyl diphosphate reductase [Flagellatimonas centrodinii]
MDIVLANPRGFCAGVDRAIEIVERALEALGSPIYVRHEVVHNRFVVDNLKAKGAIFVEEVAEIPEGATCIFSAHGVSQQVREDATRRNLTVFDATCPLVTKVHIEVQRYAREAREVVLIGHAGHPEVEGTMGQFDSRHGGRIHLVETPEDVQQLTPDNPGHMAYVTQTTLSMDDTARVIDALRARFPAILGPRKDDICYATTNRQDAVKQLSTECDVLLVVGSKNSSNSNRLRELAALRDVPAYLIDGPEDIQPEWVRDRARVGVTAGASAPEVLVQQVIARLRELGGTTVQELAGRAEHIVFSLPPALRRAVRDGSTPR